MNIFHILEKNQISDSALDFRIVHSSYIFSSSPKKKESSLKNEKSYLFEKNIFTPKVSATSCAVLQEVADTCEVNQIKLS